MRAVSMNDGAEFMLSDSDDAEEVLTERLRVRSVRRAKTAALVAAAGVAALMGVVVVRSGHAAQPMSRTEAAASAPRIFLAEQAVAAEPMPEAEPMAEPAPEPAPEPEQAAAPVAAVSGVRKCWTIAGVKVAEHGEPTPGWPGCSKKWSEDCTSTGCCLDAGMQCFQKSDGWAACNDECHKLDKNNDTWTCTAVAPPSAHTHEACEEVCKADPTCATAIFNSDAGGSCSLSTGHLTEVVWAGDNFNSTFCADESEEATMEGLIAKVREYLPFQQPHLPIVTCSWGGEDCSETKCCNDVKCDKNFMNCNGYSCYKKTEYFSGCRIDTPPAEWEGTWLGGPREHRAIGPAGGQVAVHGTSLYCFAVVSWDAPRPKPFWSTEAELANNIKEHGISWMQCDGHDVYGGVPTPKAAWGSFSNIDAFQEIWKQVKAKGSWKNFDWTVKVDADAVFLPNRLKMHLDKLRTPSGARVYLENTNYRFKFMGALEVLSKEALEVFLEQGHTCIRGKHEGGEDFFMKGCMDALGIDHQSDFELLHDKYASQDGPCTDGWATAYHFHKKVISWNWCYNEAVCGNRGKTCPQGLEVEFVMPWAPNPAPAK